MSKVGLWQISGARPIRLTEARVDLGRLLESWIGEDPSLLQPGLAIVGRQITIPGSGRLDLLAIDLTGTWVVIEVKKGAVDRDTLAQGLDYAAGVASMPADELRCRCDEYLASRRVDLQALRRERQISLADSPSRDVAIMIAGTGRAPTLDRVVSFHADRHDVPITVVSFDVFATAEGGRILAREISESEGTRPAAGRAGSAAEDVLRLADDAGVGALMRRLFDAANALQLYPRAWKTSIMFTPPTRRNRMLFTVWARPVDGQLKAVSMGRCTTSGVAE